MSSISLGTTREAARRTRPLKPLLLQGALVLALVAFFLFIARNVALNLARLDINTGFGFLGRPAGFGIAMHVVDYSEQSSYAMAIVVALLNTLVLAAVCCFFATILGFFIGLMRLSTNRLVAFAALAYVETLRNIPLLLQLFFWYFAVLATLPLPRLSLSFFGWAYLNRRGLYLATPHAGPGMLAAAIAAAIGIALWILLAHRARRSRLDTGHASPLGWLGFVLALSISALAASFAGAPLRWELPALAGLNVRGGTVVVPEFVAMVVGLSLFGAAFIAELVRAGVLAVPRGQMEAGLSLGLTRARVYRQIVLPQALRTIVPPLVSQYIVLLKNSSLGAAIAYPDLMLIVAGTILNQTGQPIEVMGITMMTYLVLCLVIAAAGNALNRRVQLVER